MNNVPSNSWYCTFECTSWKLMASNENQMFKKVFFIKTDNHLLHHVPDFLVYLFFHIHWHNQLGFSGMVPDDPTKCTHVMTEKVTSIPNGTQDYENESMRSTLTGKFVFLLSAKPTKNLFLKSCLTEPLGFHNELAATHSLTSAHSALFISLLFLTHQSYPLTLLYFCTKLESKASVFVLSHWSTWLQKWRKNIHILGFTLLFLWTLLLNDAAF